MDSTMSGSMEVTGYKCLSKYLPHGNSLITALESALVVTSQPLRITTCGLLKAGKSSLLNALTDHLETELFMTGAARTTVNNQTISHKDFMYVDTPGFDATSEDDAEAWKALEIADVLLFVHDSGTGELHHDEVNFLEKFKSQPSAQLGLEQRLVVVLTRLDSNAEFINVIGETVLRQVTDCLGILPHLFTVSFTSYRKGKLEGKPKLVEYSGIPILRQYLFNNLAHIRDNTLALRNARIDDCRKQLLMAIDVAITERECRISSLQLKADQADTIMSREFGTFFAALRDKITVYDNKAY
jgi:tRNA U34 5-carboxymethylaminomethyl modifying GTPase MnmE/TrmE